MRLTKKQAREFLISYQRLLEPRKICGKEGIYDYIRKVGCIQYDPLDMVGYNPYLVLQSRVEDFKAEYLQELLYTDRKLLDGWDKCMSIYPVEDWPYFARYRADQYHQYEKEKASIDKVLPKVREALIEEGPLSSIDIKIDAKVKWGWSSTRVARAALESMYFWGELTIHHKVGTRKVYDFSEKQLPSELLSTPDPNTTMEQYYEWYVKRRIGAIGLLWNRSGDAWLGIHWMKSKDRNEAISRLVEKGELIPLEVEDIKYTFYIRKEEETLLNQIIKGVKYAPQASFIAALDNLIWDRKLIKELFGFEYKWEVYTPVSKRKYGYYVLPVLYGDKLIARFEPKYNKKTGILEITNWWWEPDIVVTEEMKKAISECFKNFLSYLCAKDIQINCNDKIIF